MEKKRNIIILDSIQKSVEWTAVKC